MKVDITEQYLRNRYIEKQYSPYDIMDEIGCSKTAVWSALRKYNIPTRNRKAARNTPLLLNKLANNGRIKIIINEDDLKYKYNILGMSTVDIANIYKCSINTIIYRMNKLGILRRTRDESLCTSICKSKLHNKIVYSRVGQILTKEILDNLYSKQELSPNIISSMYNCTVIVIKRLLIKYQIKRRSLKESTNLKRVIKVRHDNALNAWRDIEYKKRVSHSISLARIRWWNSLDEENKNQYAKLVIQCLHIRPNKPETYLGKLLDFAYPNEFKYVGNGEVMLGRRNPDFINVNGKKLVIELYGTYWHKNEDISLKIQHYEKYGYRTLIVWDKELKHPKDVLDRVVSFVEMSGKQNK